MRTALTEHMGRVLAAARGFEALIEPGHAAGPGQYSGSSL